MTIKELYEHADKIGLLTFSTIHNGEVHSRIAHFNGYDNRGIYFRTMANKPYGRQLAASLKVTVCGHHAGRIINHDAVGSIPEFAPGYTLRIIGDVKRVDPEDIIERAKTNKMLEVAARDITMYPAMANGNFIIHRAKCEIFDYDFAKVTRQHKVLRTRFAFGGATYNEAGVRIDPAKCIACGKCYKTCSFDAIEKGETYTVNPQRCDDCGSCLLKCPTSAISESLVF